MSQIIRKVTDKSGRTRTIKYARSACVGCGREILIPDYQSILTKSKHKCNVCKYLGKKINRRKRPYERTYNVLVTYCKKKNLVSWMSYEEFYVFMLESACHYCGQMLFRSEYPGPGDNYGYNLDRKDALGGYVVDNVVSCCVVCNMTFGRRFTYDEKLKIGKVLEEIRLDREKM